MKESDSIDWPALIQTTMKFVLRVLVVLVTFSAFLVHISAMDETLKELLREEYYNSNREFPEDDEKQTMLNQNQRPVKTLLDNEEQLQGREWRYRPSVIGM